MSFQVHHQEDVVHRDRGQEVHEEPALQVALADGLGVQQDLRTVLFHDPGPEVQHQIHQEERVRHHVKDDPRRSVLVLEEGDAHREDDEVSHHQHQHEEIPAKPARRQRAGASPLTETRFLNS